MLSLDTSLLERAFVEYENATGKEIPDILNRAGRNIAFRAAEFTAVASKGEIKTDLYRDPHLRYALTSLRLKKKGIGKLPAPEFSKAVEKLVAGRVGSARYMRAAWAEIVAKFGGTFKGSKFKGASSEVFKATSVSLLTEIIANLSEPTEAKAQSAEAKLFPALEKAVDFVAHDMIDFATEKLQKAAKQSGF